MIAHYTILFFQKNREHTVSFPVQQQGGYFVNEQKKISVMVPNDAVNKDLQLSITEIPDPNKFSSTTVPKKLFSKLYEFEPHGKAFGNFLTIRLPLKEPVIGKKKLTLAYSPTTQNEVPNWVYFSDDMSQDFFLKGPLPQISWMVMNNFCVVMIDKFCLFGLVGEEDDEETGGSEDSEYVNVAAVDAERRNNQQQRSGGNQKYPNA